MLALTSYIYTRYPPALEHVRISSLYPRFPTRPRSVSDMDRILLHPKIGLYSLSYMLISYRKVWDISNLPLLVLRDLISMPFCLGSACGTGIRDDGDLQVLGIFFSETPCHELANVFGDTVEY